MFPKITYCILTQNRLPALQRAILHTSPHVDRTIVIDGCSTDGTQDFLLSQTCRDLRVESKFIPQHLYQYGNHNPEKRNPYLKLAGSDGWLLVMDDDEYLEEDALLNLRQLAASAEKKDFDGIMFCPHDIWSMLDGTTYEKRYGDWWAPMFWKSYPGQHYVGHTHVRIERPGATNNWFKSSYHYKHIKDEKRMWRNSTQNYWTTVGLATNNTEDNTWLDFHRLMSKYGYLDWHLLNDKMIKGKLEQEIMNWFIQHKDAENPEERSWFIYYFKILHPEEL